MSFPRGVAVSPDGDSVYVASDFDDAVVSFDRNSATGRLSGRGCIADRGDAVGCGATEKGLKGARGIAVSPDGLSAYATSSTDGAVVSFDRNPSRGALVGRGCIADDGSPAGCGQTTTGLVGARRVAVSPDGRSVYATGFSSFAIVRFRREDLMPPRLTLKGSKTQRSSRLVKLKARTDEDTTAKARGTVTIPLVGRGRAAGSARTKKLKLKGLSRGLVAGQRKTLKLKLTPKARKLTKRAQRKGRRVKAKVAVAVVDGAGNRSSARRKVTLKGRRR